MLFRAHTGTPLGESEAGFSAKCLGRTRFELGRPPFIRAPRCASQLSSNAFKDPRERRSERGADFHEEQIPFAARTQADDQRCAQWARPTLRDPSSRN